MNPTLESIYRDHLQRVHRVCSRYCRNHEAAEDLTQDVFIRIHHGLKSFRGDSALGTWIYRLAVNTCLDHLRALKRRGGLHEAFMDDVVITHLSPLGDRVLAKVELDRILSPLRPLTRRILFLTLAEGLSYREAGEVLGLSRDSVAKTVIRFLHKYGKTDGLRSQKSVSQNPLVPDSANAVV